jgi:hypothetical protein
MHPDVRLAYQILQMDPLPPPKTDTPGELLACRQSLTPADREILVRYARLLTAEDAHPGTARCIRGAAIWEDALIIHRAWLVRQRRRACAG